MSEIDNFIGTITKDIKNSYTINCDMFSKYIGKGTQQLVFNHIDNEYVLKVFIRKKFKSLKELMLFNEKFLIRNKFVLQEPIIYVGYLQGGDYLYPVYKQKKITNLKKMSKKIWSNKYIPLIDKLMLENGYLKHGESYYGNGLIIGDIRPSNIGFDNDCLRFFDARVIKENEL